MTRLALEADINRKTFYLHYTTVDEVIDTAVREEAESIVQELNEAVLLKGKQIDVASVFFNLCIHLASDINQLRSIDFQATREAVFEKIEDALVETFTRDNRLDLTVVEPYVAYCVSFFVAGLLSVYRRWLLADSEIPLEDLAAITNIA